MVNALKMGLIPCRAHLAAQREKAVNETEGFVISSRSKLDPYQDDLLYVCVTDSLTVDFLRSIPSLAATTKLTQLVFITSRNVVETCNNLFVRPLLCLHSRCYGYTHTHTPCILRIYIWWS